MKPTCAETSVIPLHAQSTQAVKHSSQFSPTHICFFFSLPCLMLAYVFGLVRIIDFNYEITRWMFLSVQSIIWLGIYNIDWSLASNHSNKFHIFLALLFNNSTLSEMVNMSILICFLLIVFLFGNTWCLHI